MSSTASSSPATAPISLRDSALFLDFDGTLVPLQDDPDTVQLPPNGTETLLALKAASSGAVALISGRDIRDLSSRTPIDVLRAGGHGLEICHPGQIPTPSQAPVDAALRTKVETSIAKYSGVRLEDKGPVLAIHYRQNPSVEPDLFDVLSAIAKETPDYKSQQGKMVIELKPTRANKGIALASLMQSSPFEGRVPIMVGDDTTDEDAMRVARELGGFGVKVGEGDTCAEFRLHDPNAVWAWLRRLIDEHA